MNRNVVYGMVAITPFLVAAVKPASAQIVDLLHGYCGSAGQCVGNNIDSPTTNNPPTDFGFTVSPGKSRTGDLVIDILVPNNEDTAPGSISFSVSGSSLSGTSTLFSTTAWKTGVLDDYLGISGSSAQPIGNYLPSTQALDAGATGVCVYATDLGTATLKGPNGPNTDLLLNLAAGETLDDGNYIVGFLNEGTAKDPHWISTANSGAIFETTAAAGADAGTGQPDAAGLGPDRPRRGSPALGATSGLIDRSTVLPWARDP